MPIYEQIPIRLQLNMAGSPPYPPFDANTGQVAKLWRGSGAAIQLGVFDAFGVPVDLSNLMFLQFVLQDGAGAFVPLVVKTVQAVAIASLTAAEWADGIGQQATFILSAADTDQGLDAMPSKDYWISIQGKTQTGNILTYGAGIVTLFDTGSIIPSPASANTVSLSKQDLIVGDITIVPTSNNHTAIIDVSGVARTSNIILPLTGVVDGAQMRIRFNLPATPDIILQINNGSLGNVISNIQTGQVLTALLEYVFDNTLQTWVPLIYTLPAI